MCRHNPERLTEREWWEDEGVRKEGRWVKVEGWRPRTEREDGDGTSHLLSRSHRPLPWHQSDWKVGDNIGYASKQLSIIVWFHIYFIKQPVCRSVTNQTPCKFSTLCERVFSVILIILFPPTRGLWFCQCCCLSVFVYLSICKIIQKGPNTL